MENLHNFFLKTYPEYNYLFRIHCTLLGKYTRNSKIDLRLKLEKLSSYEDLFTELKNENNYNKFLNIKHYKK